MAHLIRGDTFVDGETVTGERLNKLVDNATIVDLSITDQQLANGSVTSEKLASDVLVQTSNVSLPEGNLLIGNASAKGVPIPPSAEFTVGTTLALAVGGVGSTKIADGAVTGAKLESLTNPNPAGSYGDATHYPVVIIDNKGRVTAADKLAFPAGFGGGLMKRFAGQLLQWPRVATYIFPHKLPANSPFEMWLECVIKSPHHEVGDRIPFVSLTTVGPEGYPAFGVRSLPIIPGPPDADAAIHVSSYWEATSQLFFLSTVDGKLTRIMPEDFSKYHIAGAIWTLPDAPP